MQDGVIPPLELGSVPDTDLLDLLSLEWRRLSSQQARVWSVIAELATRDPMAGIPGAVRWTPVQIAESAVDEIRAELMLTRRGAGVEVDHATNVAALPRLAAALAAGVLDPRRAIVLTETCFGLNAEHVEALLDEVLPVVGECTATALAQRARKVAVALDPEWAERRYRDAVRDRRVIGYLNEDGSATISGQRLDAAAAAAACAQVTALADAAKRAGATATLDQLRADVFLGLLSESFKNLDRAGIVAKLLRTYPPNNQPADSEAESAADPAPDTPTESPTDPADDSRNDSVADSPTESRADSAGDLHSDSAAGPTGDASADAGVESSHPDSTVDSQSGSVGDCAGRAGVQVRVGLATLLGLDEHPGEIAGWGAVTAGVARDTVARQRSGEWRYAIHDDQGQLLFDDITRRRPVGAAASGGAGGIVELLVPEQLLTDATARDHPEWADLLADLAKHYAVKHRSVQDPTARYPGKPLRRHTQIQFIQCIFPGCRRPAVDSQIDHRRDWAKGGRTDADQLAPLCGHDHGNKTERGWRLVKLDEHTFRWISPLGRRHDVRIPPVAEPLPNPIPRPPPEPPPF